MYQVITYGAINDVITEWRYWAELDFGLARQADGDDEWKHTQIFNGGTLLACMDLESVVVLQKGEIEL